MRRLFWIAPLVAALAITLVILLRPHAAPAEAGDGPAKAPAAKVTPPHLPIAQVVLFNSGVAYLQRQGEVEGSARLELSFPVQNVNDLLKSMVLEDMGGGHISAVSFDSHDPVDKTLKTFAVDLTGNPSLKQILTQARGEKVEVFLKSSAAQPESVTGMVVGIEQQRQLAGKDATVEVDLLNVWGADGVRGLRLDEVCRVRFLNTAFEQEVGRALEVLARAHDTQKKTVTLAFVGDGKRQVRVGYVVENPVWRTSYRLVVGRDGKPFLQGWAVVENPSNEDWKDVHMALVSGRPISFQTDLYQPLYVTRPFLQAEQYAAVVPPTWSAPTMIQCAPVVSPAMQWAVVPGQPPMPAPAAAPAPPVPNGAVNGPAAPGWQPAALNPQRGIITASATAVQGGSSQYLIKHTVTVPRQKSALLPIVNKELEGARVSIYNEASQARFPLLGLRLKNTTGLHLMQGPVTVFDGPGYAGDAQLLDLPPDEERLLSYALDFGTEVEAAGKESAARLVSIRLSKGTLFLAGTAREGKTYVVKNRSAQERSLLIEHPYRPGYQLVSKQKPHERARDVYRFELKVAPGKTANLEVTEEREDVNQIALSGCDDQTLRFFLQEVDGGPKFKAALKRALGLWEKVGTTKQEMERCAQRLQQITQDQNRLRLNLKEMPENSAASKRYLQKFDTQETEIDNLQNQFKKLQDEGLRQAQEYEAYVNDLDLESTPVTTRSRFWTPPSPAASRSCARWSMAPLVAN